MRTRILNPLTATSGFVSAVLGIALLLCAPLALAEQPNDVAENVHGGHDDIEEAEADHGSDEHGHHVPHFSDINWFYGLVGEKEGVEPSLLWRPPGTPVPFGALLINTAILFFLIGKFGGPAISAGLSSRKDRIAGEILNASKMKEEAEGQLEHYEGKLAEMGAEMERIKKEMREQAEADRERILDDAKKQRESLETEARHLVAQELAQARHEATLRAVSAAVQSAKEQIQSQLSAADHEKLASHLLSSLQSHLSSQEKQS